MVSSLYYRNDFSSFLLLRLLGLVCMQDAATKSCPLTFSCVSVCVCALVCLFVCVCVCVSSDNEAALFFAWGTPDDGKDSMGATPRIGQTFHRSFIEERDWYGRQ